MLLKVWLRFKEMRGSNRLKLLENVSASARAKGKREKEKKSDIGGVCATHTPTGGYSCLTP